MDKLAEGKHVFDMEIEALKRTRDALDSKFVEILDLVTNCRGKVIITGIGKSGHIAAKMAATFASLGTSSFRLHPAEAMHGDLGMISENDIVIAISYSGESDEIVKILPNIKLIGAALIGITGNENSTLAQVSDIVQVLPKFEEACCLGLAPTSSTTAVLCYGDALAVAASSIYGFKEADFGKFHPAGVLGKKLILKVNDLMAKGEKNPIINEDTSLETAIIIISKREMGMVSVVGDNHELIGIITDGDLRRMLEKGINIYSVKVKDVMTKKPIFVESTKLAAEALSIMRDKNISCLSVVENNKVIGAIKIQNIISAGIL